MKHILLLLILILSLHSSAQRYKSHYKNGNSGFPPYAIFDVKKNKYLSDFIYQDVEIVEDQYFIVEHEDETVEVFDTLMKTLLPKGQYMDASISLLNPRYITVKVVVNPEEKVSKYRVYDTKTNSIVIKGDYDFIGSVSVNGFVPFNRGGVDMMPQLVQGGKWGYLHISGREALAPKYIWCSNVNEADVARVYVGGNSRDGLYGGEWRLVNMRDKPVVNYNQYKTKEVSYYIDAPLLTVPLEPVKTDEKGSYFYDCLQKEILKYDYIIDERIEGTSYFVVSDKSWGGKKGVMNESGELVIPLEFQHAFKVGDNLLLNAEDQKSVVFSLLDKKKSSLTIQGASLKCNHYNMDNSLEKRVCMVLGENDRGNMNAYNEKLELIIEDIESPFYHGYDQDYYDIKSFGFYKNLFGYEKDGEVNYFSLDFNKSVLRPGMQEYKDDIELFLDGAATERDSIFAKKNGKWGLVNAVSQQGEGFIYDSLIYVNHNLVVAKRGSQNQLFYNGQKVTGFPVFSKLIDFSRTGRNIPGRSNVHTPYTQLLIDYKDTRYLIQFSKHKLMRKSFKEMILDRGNITKLHLSMYVKDDEPYILFSQVKLPKGTISCSGLDDWTSRSNIPIYNYRIGNLYGIIDEKGNIIFEPKYEVKRHYTTYPPEDFKYELK